MKYPITITAHYDIVDGDIISFKEYADIRHTPSGSTFSVADLPEDIRWFFCETEPLSREYIEREYHAAVHPENQAVLVLTKALGPDGREPKPGCFCEDLGTETVDLKWSAWTTCAGTWEDYAPGVYQRLSTLKPGQQMTIKSFPRKECRGLEVTIKRLYPSMWVATGAVWSCWDEVCDLITDLNLLADDDSEAEQFLKEADGDYEKANAQAIAAGYNGITNVDAFNESVPYSHYTWEPGTDVDMNVKANSFSKLMRKIDACESLLLSRDKEEWASFERMYTNH